jgi:hydrogenase-4 component F
MSVVVILLLPLAAAAFALAPLNKRWAPIATVAACVAVLILAVRLGLLVAAHNAFVVFPDWIALDGLSALILVLIALVGLTAALFSVGYMAKGPREPKRLRYYYLNFNLFLFSMLAIPVLVEPTLVWIAVELTTLCSVLLVCFENTHAALEAAWKYVVLSLMGAAVALLGFIVLFAALQAAGGAVYSWNGLLAAAPRMPAILLQTAFLLILVGFGTKAGLAPMHTWLPDAHSQAPSPVCALLSGIETTSVLYVILRLFPVMRAAPGNFPSAWALAFGLFSAGTAAFLLLQVRDYKRMFAYSSIEHMGIILMAAGFGHQAAHYGALYQALTHTLTKSFCFFAAGATILAADTQEIASVRGLIRTSPVAGASLLLGGLAIAGAPPFALFLSEFSIFRAGLMGGYYWATALLVFFVAISFFGILRHVNRMVFGQTEGAAHSAARLPVSCVATLGMAGLLVIVFGLYLPAPLHELLRQGAIILGK